MGTQGQRRKAGCDKEGLRGGVARGRVGAWVGAWARGRCALTIARGELFASGLGIAPREVELTRVRVPRVHKERRPHVRCVRVAAARLARQDSLDRGRRGSRLVVRQPDPGREGKLAAVELELLGRPHLEHLPPHEGEGRGRPRRAEAAAWASAVAERVSWCTCVLLLLLLLLLGRRRGGGAEVWLLNYRRRRVRRLPCLGRRSVIINHILVLLITAVDGSASKPAAVQREGSEEQQRQGAPLERRARRRLLLRSCAPVARAERRRRGGHAPNFFIFRARRRLPRATGKRCAAARRVTDVTDLQFIKFSCPG